MLGNIAIIIVNWQNWQDTIACLNSLQRLFFAGNVSIIVCDNGSRNESVSHISQWAEQQWNAKLVLQDKSYTPARGETVSIFESLSDNPFVFIQTGKNLGFAGGTNAGIRYALSTNKFEYLWLLNSDTEVDERALVTLYGLAKNYPKLAMMGSTIVEYEQRDIVQCAGGCHYNPYLTRMKNIFSGKPLTEVLEKRAKRVKLDYVYGASMFLSIEAVKKVGLLNEEYFLFYEELDYVKRLQKQGYAIGWCKYSLVYHKGGASLHHAAKTLPEKRLLANYYENLSTLKYTANHHRSILWLVAVNRFVLKSLVLIWRREFYLFKPLFLAYLRFFRIYFGRKQNVLYYLKRLN